MYLTNQKHIVRKAVVLTDQGTFISDAYIHNIISGTKSKKCRPRMDQNDDIVIL